MAQPIKPPLPLSVQRHLEEELAFLQSEYTAALDRIDVLRVEIHDLQEVLYGRAEQQ